MQEFETDVTFVCPKCGKLAETKVSVPEPDWSAAESLSDLHSEDQTEASCNQCGTTFEAYVVASGSSCDVTLTDHSDTVVRADTAFYSPDPDDEAWSDYDVPENPYSIFEASQRQLDSLLEADGSDDGRALVNRMIFAQHISAMEAFLADTLINEVMDSEKSLSALLEGNTDLAGMKFTLTEIANSPDLVKSKVREYLRGVVYHNLPKVDAIYRHALQVEILKRGDDHSLLMSAIQFRHDCVHRNGYDTSGHQLDVFTKDYVRRISQAIGILVGRVELATSPF